MKRNSIFSLVANCIAIARNARGYLHEKAVKNALIKQESITAFGESKTLIRPEKPLNHGEKEIQKRYMNMVNSGVKNIKSIYQNMTGKRILLDMELPQKNTIPCLKNKMESVKSVCKKISSRADWPLTISTEQKKSEGYCAVIAMLDWVISEIIPNCSKQQSVTSKPKSVQMPRLQYMAGFSFV